MQRASGERASGPPIQTLGIRPARRARKDGRPVPGAVVLPILTRLYHPSEIGLFGMYLSFISLASVGTTLKFASAIVSAKNHSEAAYLGIVVVLSVGIKRQPSLPTTVAWLSLIQAALGFYFLLLRQAIAKGVAISVP